MYSVGSPVDDEEGADIVILGETSDHLAECDKVLFYRIVPLGTKQQQRKWCNRALNVKGEEMERRRECLGRKIG